MVIDRPSKAIVWLKSLRCVFLKILQVLNRFLVCRWMKVRTAFWCQTLWSEVTIIKTKGGGGEFFFICLASSGQNVNSNISRLTAIHVMITVLSWGEDASDHKPSVYKNHIIDLFKRQRQNE